ncbi:MAG: hypothetical protein M1812_003187 [Candelaria pacifica]|nr:MAG: hypothetical protein M1812_003187 [Candelaria pacifica]
MARASKKRKLAEAPADDGDLGLTPSMAECPYAIEFPAWDTLKNMEKKRKSVSAQDEGEMDIEEVAHNPFQKNLAMTYIVRPQNHWNSNKKYRNFVVGDETFGVHDYVLVNHSPIPPGTVLETSDERQFWIARVLEIRALDQQHVYLRVFWLYWPDELPGGRRDYHGKHELIASNHMEIIDAMTVAGRADVHHWLENDGDDVLTGLYWRQTYHCFKGAISALPGRCVCKKPTNPDKILLGCSNKACGSWLHEECVIEDALTKTQERLVGKTVEGADKRSTKRKSGAGATKFSQKASHSGLFEARIEKGSENTTQIRVVITDLRKDGVEPSTWEEYVVCLVCHTEIK